MRKTTTLCIAILLITTAYTGCSDKPINGSPRDTAVPVMEAAAQELPQGDQTPAAETQGLNDAPTSESQAPTSESQAAPSHGIQETQMPQATAASTPAVASPSVPTTEPVDVASLLENAELSALHPIIFDGYLLGGFVGGDFLAPYYLDQKLRGGELYKLYTNDAYIGHGVGYVKPYVDGDGPYTEIAEIFTEVTEDNYVAISCDWDCLPRKAVRQSPDDDELKGVVRDVLAEFGLSNPVVNIVQNYKIDLDGDGIDEVIIYAEYAPEADYSDVGLTPQFPVDYDRIHTQDGCYALLFVRKVVDGKAENFILRGKVHTMTDDSTDASDHARIIYGICGFFDFNGDGDMEILTFWQYYEGWGYDIWKASTNAVNCFGGRTVGPG